MKKTITFYLFPALLGLTLSQVAQASGHGPVFSLATPTNPKGGWSLDTNFMGRGSTGSGLMFRPSLGYGLTENLKISVSAPVPLRSDPFSASRLSAFTSMMGNYEANAIWRFHRQDTGIGSRFESAAIGGVIVPGPQDAGSLLQPMQRGIGGLVGGVTGIASRSHYAWAGATYQRYAASNSNRRPDLIYYTLAYAYRPPSWRTDSGWDWRIFGELAGERSGHLQSAGQQLRGSESHQVFLGPTTLGVYKNYAVSGGIQFPVYRPVTPFSTRERFRFALNLAYFF